MGLIGPIVAVVVIVAVAALLLRQLHPHAVLLTAGLLMLVVGAGLGLGAPEMDQSTGFFGFDLFRRITESFSGTLSRVGLMIMAIGGFVATMDHIGASQALVRVCTAPLQLLRSYPYVVTSLVIVVGQVLFVCIPSAAGLGLLLMASIFPLLVQLGVSRLSAVASIVACTSFGMGPASAMSARAAEIVELPLGEYFFLHQLPLVVPTALVMAALFYVANRWGDARQTHTDEAPDPVTSEPKPARAPAYYAVLPLLPVVLLLAFSSLFAWTDPPIILDTTTAILISVSVAFVVNGIRARSLATTLNTFKVFWSGMGNIFKTVVTLIIAADLFSQGLMGLDVIDGLVSVSQGLGLGGVGMGIIMAALIFLASMLMGSGNASFFAFGPLVPKLAADLGVPAVRLLLPMQMAASMGRSVSPISGVIIATSDLAGVAPLALARRTALPLIGSVVFMLGWHNVVG